MNTSVKTLLCFLLLLAVALVYGFLNWPRQARVTHVPGVDSPTGISTKSGVLPSDSGSTQEDQVQEKNVTLVNRNIFAPLFSLPSRDSIPDIKTIPPESVSVLPVELPPPPRPLPIFLGKLRHAGRQKVFLSVEGKVYVVGPGDSFGNDNAYRLVEISSQNLLVKHQDDKENFQIDAAEQPISMLSSSGSSFVEPTQAVVPTEINVPVEPGRLDKEVPIDNVVDE
jgi:hypothetical protein